MHYDKLCNPFSVLSSPIEYMHVQALPYAPVDAQNEYTVAHRYLHDKFKTVKESKFRSASFGENLQFYMWIF